MSLHRFFLAGVLPDRAADAVELALGEEDRHHLMRVLRLEAGDRIAVAGADGRSAEATLVEVTPQRVVADLDEPVSPPTRPRVSLAPALARRERMELTIQKATELGAAEILPVITARSVVRLDDERGSRRAERWRRIAEEAAKQSQRSDVPRVSDLLGFSALLEAMGRYDLVLVPWEEATSSGAGIGEAIDAAGLGADASVLVVIGPEGGLEPGEAAQLEAAGGVIVSLGDTVLRTETAAIVAVALAIYELGGLGGRAVPR